MPPLARASLPLAETAAGHAGIHAERVDAAVVEVEVDPETGEVKVPKIWIAHDVGRAINRTTTIGQVEGDLRTPLPRAIEAHGGAIQAAAEPALAPSVWTTMRDPSQNVIELHGNIRRVRCADCGTTIPGVFGAGIYQINVAVSQAMASTQQPGAVAGVSVQLAFVFVGQLADLHTDVGTHGRVGVAVVRDDMIGALGHQDDVAGLDYARRLKALADETRQEIDLVGISHAVPFALDRPVAFEAPMR